MQAGVKRGVAFAAGVPSGWLVAPMARNAHREQDIWLGNNVDFAVQNQMNPFKRVGIFAVGVGAVLHAEHQIQ